MYTFTYFHNVAPRKSWALAATAWNKLHIKLIHRYGRFSYVKVLESHKVSPYPHLHILSNKLFQARYLCTLALSCGFGYQNRITRVSPGGAGNYVSKYLTKSWSNEESIGLRTELRLRLVCYSRGLGHGCVFHGRYYFCRISGSKIDAVLYLRLCQFTLLTRGGQHISADFDGVNPSMSCHSPPPRKSIKSFERRNESLPDYPEDTCDYWKW